MLPFIFAACGKGGLDYSFAGRGSSAEVAALLSRVLRSYRPLESLSAAESAALNASVAQFDLSISSSCGEGGRTAGRSALCFAMSGGGGSKVKIVATSGPDLARGVATYLRVTSAYSFAWNRTGGNAGPPIDLTTLPSTWPAVKTKASHVAQYRNGDISYYQNVVASSYSHVWWSRDDWQQMVDWMALSGINVALLYGSTELVERSTFAKFGIDHKTFGNWSNAPAWFAWSRGQSMHGVGDNAQHLDAFGGFLAAQHALARETLAMMRSLGIVAVLPAFQGNVPPQLHTLRPSANITAQGGGRHWAAWLDALDPLFGEIGDEWMRQLREMYSTASSSTTFDFEGCWFEADGYFTSGRPPWFSIAETHRVGDVDAARAHVAKAYEAINRTVPDAVLLYQGWTLGGDDDFTKGLVEAVPPGRLVISDMRCEDGSGGCEWTDKDFSFDGAPFIWGTLHNFGGVLGMWGSLSEISSNASYAFQSNASTVAGLGAFPEGINQNPTFYTFLYDSNWSPTPIEPTKWLDRYAVERYTLREQQQVKLSRDAWRALGATVYGGDQGPKRGNDFCSASDGLTSYPVGAEQEHVGPQPSWYNETAVWDAWAGLVDLASTFEGTTMPSERMPSTLLYDLINVGRECLAKRSNVLFAALEAAGSAGLIPGGNAATVAKASAAMAELQHDADALLATSASFSLGRWVRAARVTLPGASAAQQQWLAWQARSQVTTWLPACDPRTHTYPTSNTTKGICGARSDLADYANKQWGGLVGSYYTKRMACYGASRETSQSAADFVLNVSAYNVCIDRASWSFQNSALGNNASWPWTSGADPVVLSRALITKWRPRST